MLKFHFISSPDVDFNGEVTFFKNELIVGRSKRSDIVIDDLECSKYHLYIVSEKDKIYIELFPGAPFFHVNKKKYIGKKSVKVNDIIKIGNSEFCLLEVKYKEKIDEAAFYKERYIELTKNSQDVREYLEQLELELLEAEYIKE